MNQYTIKKVLNNNVLICQHQQSEVIIIGKGLGFNKKPGMTIRDPETIEKVFKLESKSEQDHYKMLIAHTDERVLRVVIDSVQMIMSHFDLSHEESFVVSLTDHLIFALKRMENGQLITNPFLSETKYSYPEAYQIAKKVVTRINLQLNIDFPEDEVGFIALHIASQINDVEFGEMQTVPKLINNAIRMIEHDMGIEIPESSIPYQRFVRHIHFLLQRLKKGEGTTIELNFENLLKTQYPLCYNIAVKIVKMIQSQIDVRVYEAEVAYLTMHIHQLSLASKKQA
ncbi:glucose PTS transporter transcription antiterminator GlcT [Staphylococcus schleiferi]|uniref:Transcriptional antiterminator n=1 Tax=Staphylococcus schleiferi TaxID=1295 RepID=A0A7Z7VXB1_STASC|nr:transcription antiterminator [Staphylococcus schleiferi]QGS45288.1 PRD domain-containing protein [Mammaliicoccus fleurettii]MBF1993191.1 transcription antiterminator [Staphylococcus schleiferi]MBF2038152.1 transcription antiterminator [Staphylococcus schleiferi]MBF2100296.1 transcription antiterminator [Staphylococcus schleiferi]MBF2102601.1 transcription antiterminator [Staphylococcus schleiferi]